MSNKKTLLLVANYDSGVGYAWWLMESFWGILATHYSNHYRVLLAYPSISELPLVIKEAPLEVVEHDFNPTNPLNVLKQCRFLKNNNVHTIYFSDKPTWHWRYFLYKLFKVRCIIVHDHTPGQRTIPVSIKFWLKKLVHRIPRMSVDGAIGATEFVQQRLIKVSGLLPDKCYAAPNGLPVQENPVIAADLHNLFKIPDNRKILIMASRACRYKGIKFILQCISHLLSIGRWDLHFLFIGNGPDLPSFISISKRLHVSEYCTFAGQRNNIPELLEGADIAVHPSKGEVGYSLSILEYMRAGLPIVVPDNSSVCGATEHGLTGLIYQEGDVKGASAAIKKLIVDDTLRARLGANAREAVQQYSLEKTHYALIDAFGKIDRKGLLISNQKGSGVAEPK